MSERHYKIRLESGRVLGPLDLERVRQLVVKNRIVGTETARVYPDGDWQDINLITEIAALLISKAGETLRETGTVPTPPAAAGAPKPPGTTKMLPKTQPLPGTTAPAQPMPPPPDEGTRISSTRELPARPTHGGDDDKTEIGELDFPDQPVESDDEEPTRVELEGDGRPPAGLDNRKVREIELEAGGDSIEMGLNPIQKRMSEEKTVVFQRGAGKGPFALGGTKGQKAKDLLKATAIAIAAGMVMYELFLASPPAARVGQGLVRASLPSFIQGQPDAKKSAAAYAEGAKYYFRDTIADYRVAVSKFQLAASLDPGNVRALALLASTYLNLIDASNKDENYFAVISKLIDLSRAKSVDLPETVIADVEFFVTVNRPEAAQNRIVEYTKTHEKFGLEMFYYLALAYYARGDYHSAATYLSQYPDAQAFSAKIFYLRGRIAEALGDNDDALIEYQKGVKFYAAHAKSRLRIATIMNGRGQLKDAAGHLDFLVTHPDLLAPIDLAQAAYLHGLLSEIYQKWGPALSDLDRAVALDPDNHDYLLEMYTLRARSGENVESVKTDAKMYFYLGQGERAIKDGKYQDALNSFLQARQTEDKSYLPPLKIGDMFLRQGDIADARLNYKLATDRAPKNIQVWSKYIAALIQSYEWDDARAAMSRFRNLAVPQSTIDKATADLYEKQGDHLDAQTYYRSAMSRDTIDPTVYIAYAKSLMATKNYKDAPFFFALALRYDPLNTEAIIGTAKCVAETDSIDRAITLLQDELQKGAAAKADLLSAIAEFLIQKGNWDEAQENIDQAMQADPEAAYPWKVQARIDINYEGTKRGAVDRALAAYKSYSDRNPSDPSGYLERYKIYRKRTEFDKADDELKSIFAVYPKYPYLHYYKADLLSVESNHREAAKEYQIELQNNPNDLVTRIAYGKELLQLSDVAGALAQFSKAMQINPAAPEPKQEAGYCNFLLKNYQAAIALFQAALVYDRGNPMIYKRMGEAYRQMGDPVSAGQAFRKYIEMEPDAPDKTEIMQYVQ